MKHSSCRRILRLRSNNRRVGIRDVFLTLVMLGVAGCSSLPANLAADGAIRVERQDSRNATIGPVQVGADAENLRVSGTLRKTLMRRGWIPRHLHVVTQAADGALLSTDVVPYHRHRVKSGRAHFAHTLTVRSENVHSVKFEHHDQRDQCG